MEKEGEEASDPYPYSTNTHAVQHTNTDQFALIVIFPVQFLWFLCHLEVRYMRLGNIQTLHTLYMRY